MRIAYVVNGIERPSGGMRVVLTQADRLQKRGHVVELWNYGTAEKPFQSCGAGVIPFDSSKLDEPDIVVLTDTYFIPYTYAKRQKRGTYILIQHDYEWYGKVNNIPTGAVLFNELRGYFSEGRCKLLVVSTWLGHIMRDKYGLEACVVRNGVDSELFYPTVPLVPPSNPTVLLLYDAQVWKAFNDAMEACLLARKVVPDLRILVAGAHIPDKVRDELKALSGITIMASPRQSDLAGIYSSATVFLSTSWKEGFGLPGLEAMACGTTVVTTDSGGNREYVIPGENALTVPSSDTKTMSESLVRVLQDSALRKTLVRNGKQRAKEFSWNDSIDLLEKLFMRELS